MTASNHVSARVSEIPAAEPSQPGKRRTEVVIVGAGDELLIEVGPALGDQFRTFSADTAGDIASLELTSWIGVFDATSQATGRNAFALLEEQYGAQPWIVLCADADRANWRDVLSRGGACAVIARGDISVETFAAALAKAMQRLANLAQEAPKSRAATPRLPLLWLVGAAVFVVVAGIGWWLSHSHAAKPTPTVTVTAVEVPANSSDAHAGHSAGLAGKGQQAAPASVEDLLSMARVAFKDPAAQLPKPDAPLQGTSALELYGAVLLQQPKNDEAVDGVRRLQAVARQRVQNAIAAGDADTAARLLAILQRADFAPEELRSLEAAVAAARVKQLAAQTRSAMAAGNFASARQLLDQLVALNGERSPVAELRKELDSRKLDADLAAAAEQVHSAIAAGSLLEPEANNARAHLLAMRELSRTSPQTAAAQHDLLVALLRRVQTAIGRQDFDSAQQTLSAAQDFGSKAELADARGALESALAAKRTADAAAAAAKAARLNASALDAKAAAAAAVILSPRPARKLQVDYPPAALAQNIQGYAVVEFMLNPNGSVSAPTVIESSPRGTFDSAALAAVKRASFATNELADPKKAQHARFKINFTLADGTAAAPSKAPQTVATAPAPNAAPTTTAAPAAPAAGGSPSQVLSPKPTKPLQVDYPAVALALNRTGYVIVEFMLNPDGSPDSPTVVESSPAKIFDYEALVAVKRAKFVTTGLADPSKPQRARVKINFKGS